MDISTKTVTTKVHTATATIDDLKTVAILAVKNKLGLSDAAILSSDASAEADGSIAVSIVENVPAAAEAPSSGAPQSDEGSATVVPPAPQIATLTI